MGAGRRIRIVALATSRGARRLLLAQRTRLHRRNSASTRCSGADDTWIGPSNGASMSTIRYSASGDRAPRPERKLVTTTALRGARYQSLPKISISQAITIASSGVGIEALRPAPPAPPASSTALPVLLARIVPDRQSRAVCRTAARCANAVADVGEQLLGGPVRHQQRIAGRPRAVGRALHIGDEAMSCVAGVSAERGEHPVQQDQAGRERMHVAVDGIEPGFGRTDHQAEHQRRQHHEDVGKQPHDVLGVVLPMMRRHPAMEHHGAERGSGQANKDKERQQQLLSSHPTSHPGAEREGRRGLARQNGCSPVPAQALRLHGARASPASPRARL